MALTINTNIKNDADGYSLDAKQVKGGYVAVLTQEEMAGLPIAIVDSGSLCLVLEEEKFYLRTTAGNWTELPASYLGLTDEQVSVLSSGITANKVINYDTHIYNTDIHVTLSDKDTWNTHVENTDIHVTTDDKTNWNNHIVDTAIHVTETDKEIWNNKLDLDDLIITTGSSLSTDNIFEVSDPTNIVAAVNKNGYLKTKAFDSSKLADIAFSGSYDDLYNIPRSEFQAVNKVTTPTPWSPKVIYSKLDQCLYILQGKRHPVVCSENTICSETVFPKADSLDNGAICGWGLICSDEIKATAA